MSKVIVLGVGNILLSDEGFGVRVIEHLKALYSSSTNVSFLDGGTIGFELLRFLSDAEKLILIDAIDGGNKPGTLYRFDGESLGAYYRQKVSIHQLSIQEIIHAFEIIGKPIPNIAIFGVQPASLDIGVDLSMKIAPLIPVVAAQVVDQLIEWGVPAGKNPMTFI